VVLVDERNRPFGIADKLQAHRDGGQLHRAFSVFVFDSAGRIMLQRRASTKYHFAGRWSNACCGHPRRGETVLEAAHRRLPEELGFDTPLHEAFTFLYTATDDATGLTEREFDHVLVGEYDCDPCPNPREVGAWRWAEQRNLLQELDRNSEAFTPWFAPAYRRMVREDLALG
jgi:isopentenyl-diphosphate delta-isomerase